MLPLDAQVRSVANVLVRQEGAWHLFLTVQSFRNYLVGVF
jgi:hypothetical protein